jgi:hypothetical protein
VWHSEPFPVWSLGIETGVEGILKLREFWEGLRVLDGGYTSTFGGCSGWGNEGEIFLVEEEVLIV